MWWEGRGPASGCLWNGDRPGVLVCVFLVSPRAESYG